jgi:SP family general alpha glucoside:H+ symporter-like MFS transporter
MEQGKPESETIENHANAEEMAQPGEKGGAPLMRTKADDLGVWQSVRQYKVVGLIAMAAAFSASLDGYRKALLALTCPG